MRKALTLTVATPASFAANDGWKAGQPGDTELKGDW
jgi:hypothetical protein